MIDCILKVPLMLWLRSVIFTVLVPGTVAVGLPRVIAGSRGVQTGWWRLGYVLVMAGCAVYFSCLLSFIGARGTPAIFFARPVRVLVGSEPSRLVRGRLYRFSRNPMYLGVLAVIFGQALLFASGALARYGVGVLVVFYLVVTLLEEPHLKARDGAAFEAYCREVPRWLA